MPVYDETVALGGNYLYDDASILWEDSGGTTLTDPTEFYYPADNVLDARPNRPMRWSSTTADNRDVYFSVNTELAASQSFDPEVLVLANCQDRGDNLNRFEQRSYTVTLYNSTTGESGSFTQKAQKTLTPTTGSDFLIDFSAAASRKRQYWQVNVQVASGTMSGGFQIGSIFLGEKYTFPENPFSGMTTSVRNMNTVIGRSSGAVLVHRSYQPGRVVRGRFMCTTDEQRDTFLRMVRGHSQGVLPTRLTYFNRLNWITALVPPTEWSASSSPDFGMPLVGRFTDVSVETRHMDVHVASFTFEEIAAEVT